MREYIEEKQNGSLALCKWEACTYLSGTVLSFGCSVEKLLITKLTGSINEHSASY